DPTGRNIAMSAIQPACTNTAAFGSSPAPTPGNTSTNFGVWAGEYTAFTAAVAGQQYTASSTTSTDYLTVRFGSPAGTVLISGTGPLTFTPSSSGDVYVHVNTNSSCGTENVSRSISLSSPSGTDPCVGIVCPPGQVCVNGLCVTPVVGCTNTAAYGNNPAPTAGNSATVFCSYAGEYSTWTATTAGQQYTVSSTVATDFITVRTGTFDGPVLISGTTSLTFTTVAAGDIFVHVNTNSSCGTENACRDITLSAAGVTDPCDGIVCPPGSTCVNGICEPDPVVPANDDCANAVSLLINADGGCPANGTSGTTVNATQSGSGPSCDTGAHQDVWFTFNSGDHSELDLSFVQGTISYSIVDIFTGTCEGLVEVTCIINSQDLDQPIAVTPNTVYYMRVSNHADFDTPGDFTICLSAPDFVTVNSSVMLDGAFNSGTGLMRDDLRVAGYIPTAQPYAGAPYNHAGTETVNASVFAVEGNDAIVDWVLLELRDQTAPTTVISKRAALVQRDGNIVDLDGTSAVKFLGVPSSNYYLAVRHRNHNGVMTAATYPLIQIPTSIDLTSAATATYGTNARKTNGTVMTMWAGNANSNTLINYAGTANDRTAILNQLGATTFLTPLAGYYATDVNMNGQVSYAGTSNDRTTLLNSLGATTFLTPISEQLP
ncbi:MAG: hypothetical protein M3R08_01765, partial [Bacteroidota bacterium]|nr:hypothetical protein [Bacteroidota bacterium]